MVNHLDVAEKAKMVVVWIQVKQFTTKYLTFLRYLIRFYFLNLIIFLGYKGEQNGTTNGVLSDSKYIPHDSSQEPIFPPELKLESGKLAKKSLKFQSSEMLWYRPTTLAELLQLKKNHPEAKLVVGNTELGIEMKFKKSQYPVMIQPNYISELNEIHFDSDGVNVGASVTWSILETTLRNFMESKNAEEKYKFKVFDQIIEMLRWFAGKQIRNVSSIAGNIMTGSPISDLNPIFMASGIILTLASEGKTRKIPMDDKFYTGYRKTTLDHNEILLSLHIPFTKKNEYFVAYKQARRREDDIAIVNGAFFYTLSGKFSGRTLGV